MHWLKNPITPLKKDVKLLKITEVDGFYRSNPFILSGYRQAKFLYSGRHLVLLQALGSKFYHFLKNLALNFWFQNFSSFSIILLFKCQFIHSLLLLKSNLLFFLLDILNPNDNRVREDRPGAICPLSVTHRRIDFPAYVNAVHRCWSLISRLHHIYLFLRRLLPTLPVNILPLLDQPSLDTFLACLSIAALVLISLCVLEPPPQSAQH